MSTNSENRVLIRRGARELSAAEVNHVTGNGDILLTLLSVIFTGGVTRSDHHLDS